MTTRRADDGGSAIVEFLGLGLALLLPLLYVLVTLFTVQRAVFAVSAAAREAGRAFATAGSTDLGRERAGQAAALVLADQTGGTQPGPEVTFVPAGAGCGAAAVAPRLIPGSSYTVCVRQSVPLPFADRGLLRRVSGGVTVTGRYGLVVDRFAPCRATAEDCAAASGESM